MNQPQWLASTDPGPMLDHLEKQGKLSARKVRLFTVACCRRLWPLLQQEGARQAIEIAEQVAETLAQGKDPAEHPLLQGRDLSLWEAQMVGDLRASGDLVQWAGQFSLWGIAMASTCGMTVPKLSSREAAEQEAQAVLLRDLFGNPFHPVSLDPGWRTAKVSNQAATAYQERQLPSGHLAPQRLAALAEALEESGCNDPAILDHLRSPEPHVRGCHVIDALLAKG